MKIQKEKAIVQLSNEVLREMKLSNFLSEEATNIRRLESIDWRYKSKKYNISLVSLEQDKIFRFINFLTNKKIFSDELAYQEAVSVELRNSRIKDYFKIKKLFLDGNEDIVKIKQNQNLEESFYDELVNGDKTNIEKYVIERDIQFINEDNKYELIKNIAFSNIKLNNLTKIKALSRINEDSKLTLIKSREIKEISNSDMILVFIDRTKYLSKEYQLLISSIYDKVEKNIHDKIYFIIEGKTEDISSTQIEADIKNHMKDVKGLPEIKCKFICLEKAEISSLLIKNLEDEELKDEFVARYKKILSNYISEENEFIVTEDLVQTILELSGIEELQKEIINNIYINASEKFIKDSTKSLGLVLENISTKLSSKINILNKNNNNLYELSEEIKDEISKMNLDSFNLKYIAENEFKEVESKINYILKSIKHNIIAGMESSLIKDNYITSYDKESLGTIVKDIQVNTLSSAQVVIDREIEKIKILCIESQYKIYIESQYKLSQESQKRLKPIAREKFNELVKEFTKTSAEEPKFAKNDFELQNYINKFSGLQAYIYGSYESNGTYTETEFDSSGATIGTLSFALAGATIGAIISVMFQGLNIVVTALCGLTIASIFGFIATSKKEVVKEREVKVYKVDTKALRSDINEILDKIVLDTTNYIVHNFRNFKLKHMDFLESDMSKYLCCLEENSDNIINSHKTEMNDMIDIKFKIDKYIKLFIKIKDEVKK